jgi:putative hydrolase of the HAD superfamily
MIRGIIFDCFGVLYQGSLEHLRDYTAREDWPELANLSLSSDYGYLSREEYIEQVGQITHKAPREIAAIMQTSHIRNQILVEYIRTLHLQYKVALLSNVGRDLIQQLFTPQELTELFDVVVLSSEVGMIKPDPAIYELTAARLGISTQECVMIDDMVDNVRGAESVGMHGVVYTTTDSLFSDVRSLTKIN